MLLALTLQPCLFTLSDDLVHLVGGHARYILQGLDNLLTVVLDGINGRDCILSASECLSFPLAVVKFRRIVENLLDPSVVIYDIVNIDSVDTDTCIPHAVSRPVLDT